MFDGDGNNNLDTRNSTVHTYNEVHTPDDTGMILAVTMKSLIINTTVLCKLQNTGEYIFVRNV